MTFWVTCFTHIWPINHRASHLTSGSLVRTSTHGWDYTEISHTLNRMPTSGYTLPSHRHLGNHPEDWFPSITSRIVTVPYCFARSSVIFQGRTALKIVEFDPDWAFPDCNSSLNSPMGRKWCTKLEVAWKRCPIVLQGHPSNFKVTRLLKIVEFDPDWAFPDCNSSLNSPMATKWCTKLEVA